MAYVGDIPDLLVARARTGTANMAMFDAVQLAAHLFSNRYQCLDDALAN